ncbi:PDC sensor domain-containing protein [Aquiflexum gelatinilyticum]|uniref:PDC sensor domain-containing protein n=1 Tax=Aquiflexum gelatinilyticum TaxID=2961943 RepID=UPI0021679CAE|nr:PDC sensor domain-containing protein [Aquiflexum gelatinilyticum]MCS4434389.1 PDC sensor domain-containing protein [Aquiflexum gelatinilyticum]
MKSLFYFCFFVSICLFSCSSPKESESTTDFFEINSFISLLEYDLEVIEEEIVRLGRFSENLFVDKKNKLANADPDKYKIVGVAANSEPGANPEKSSLFIPTISDNKEAVKELILLTNPLDDEFKRIVKEIPVISQVYFNSKYHLNRLYPPYDVNLLEPDINVTNFNFYYQGDEKNNPSRVPVWVDEIYIDPVGRGWMITLTYPVYAENELKMVLGFDITLNDIIENYINKTSNQFLIIDGTGTVVAGKGKAIEALSLPSLKNYTYTQTITSDSYRKEDFNLFKSKDKNVRVIADKIINSGEKILWLSENKTKLKIICQKMSKLDWYVLEIQF